MRYPLAKAKRLGDIVKAGGAISGVAGILSAVGRRALGPLALPLAVGGGLMWLGRTLADGFVDVGDQELHIKLGVLFDEHIPLEAVASVARTEWSLLGGLGVRSNARDMVAVATVSGPVAELGLSPARRLPILPGMWWIDASRLVVSPEDLDGFIADVERHVASRAQ